MQESQTNELRAALERAAATMRQSTANSQVANRFGEMTPPGLPGWVSMADYSTPRVNGFSPTQSPQNAMASAQPDPNRGNMTVPLPMARPASAPQAPQATPDNSGMNFFTRNAMMMQDPNGGGYIDPQGAAKAQASLPRQDQGATIQNMLSRLLNRANS